MTELLPPWPIFTTFLIASFVLAVTPGPGVFYVVTRSVAQGRRSRQVVEREDGLLPGIAEHPFRLLRQ